MEREEEICLFHFEIFKGFYTLLKINNEQVINKKDSEIANDKYSKEYKSNMTISDFLTSVIIGLMLGDLYASRFSPRGNTRLCFDQSEIHYSYLIHLYQLFQIYVTVPPKKTNRKADSFRKAQELFTTVDNLKL